jgi:phosphoadenosine phosphosulfate reductase
MALLDTLAPAPDIEPYVEGDFITDRVADLNARYDRLPAAELIAVAARELFPGKLAMVSSFGAESSVLLHLLSEVDRTLPVIFLDTGRLFAETLQYRTRLTEQLALSDVRTISPERARLRELDPHRALWMTNPDMCCQIRKVEPLSGALDGFDAWITGRKRFQNAERASLPVFEANGERIKVNPLVSWSGEELKGYMLKHDLPAHPLVGKGYPSIGCVPCTSKVQAGEDERSGRWRDLDKDECGIHIGTETDGSGI